MIRTFSKQLLSLALSFLLVIVTMPAGSAAQAPSPGPSRAAHLPAAELQQLVAPSALYPDESTRTACSCKRIWARPHPT
jgi:hypothetical protein